MDYHSDRFEDCSFLASRDGKLIALFPANRSGDTVHSHGGLTYGGVVLGAEARLPSVIETLSAIVGCLRTLGVSKLVYKTIPWIYHTAPAEEDRYWLFLNNATRSRCDVLSVVDLQAPLAYQSRRSRSVTKAEKRGLTVSETDDYESFWRILSENLADRYGLQPVHTIAEIRLLAQRFPSEIRLHGVYDSGTMIAGAVVFLTTNVCHVQYNAANKEGKEAGAQDLLLHRLLSSPHNSRRYFDFGVSTERQGTYLNAGLIDYKEGFGARTVAHDFFTMDLVS